jgi:hypothetical protein
MTITLVAFCICIDAVRHHNRQALGLPLPAIAYALNFDTSRREIESGCFEIQFAFGDEEDVAPLG